MTEHALTATSPSASFRLRDLFRPTKTELDTSSRPSDAMVVFAVMWGMAMTFSAASHLNLLGGNLGVTLMVLSWSIIAVALGLVMRPRRSGLLVLLAVLMLAQYALRTPVSSNNQTIATFMNVAIIAVIGPRMIRVRSLTHDRDQAYERLRVVARALLATMYFFGIFHKINADFLNPLVSCATALYVPLTRPLGLSDYLIGAYGAIAATFIVEAIALVCLYWRRFFWVGLILSLPFHFVIPISGFSWYMDFSSLVFALYMLSVPREVAAGLYSTGVALVRRVPWFRAGTSAIVILAVGLGVAGAVALALRTDIGDPSDKYLLWHSAWLLVWTMFGGATMVLMTRAALLELPYSQRQAPGQPWWLYLIPGALFLTCFSPYLGLKTESSIAMFSNLHTEGGESNHLLFPEPPYLFDYQSRVARVIESSNPGLVRQFGGSKALVEHDLALRLRAKPDLWVTYEVDGRRYERVTWRTFTGHRPTRIERRLLDFKPVEYGRPKRCTH